MACQRAQGPRPLLPAAARRSTGGMRARCRALPHSSALHARPPTHLPLAPVGLILGAAVVHKAQHGVQLQRGGTSGQQAGVGWEGQGQGGRRCPRSEKDTACPDFSAQWPLQLRCPEALHLHARPRALLFRAAKHRPAPLSSPARPTCSRGPGRTPAAPADPLSGFHSGPRYSPDRGGTGAPHPAAPAAQCR